MTETKQSLRTMALAPLGRVAREVLYRAGLHDHAQQILWRVTGRGHAARSIRAMRMDFYSTFIRPGDLVYDIGANIGDYAEVLGALGARVVAIEPQPSCVKRLRQRFRLARRVTVEQVAVAAVPGTIEVYAPVDGSVIATASQKWMHEGRFSDQDWTRHFSVKAVTLDDLISRHGVPKFIKIDIEGFESQALAGLSTAVESISFEFAREFVADTAECIAILSRLGDYRFNFAAGEDKHFSYSEWMSGSALLAQLESLHGDAWGDVYVCGGATRSADPVHSDPPDVTASALRYTPPANEARYPEQAHASLLGGRARPAFHSTVPWHPRTAVARNHCGAIARLRTARIGGVSVLPRRWFTLLLPVARQHDIELLPRAAVLNHHLFQLRRSHAATRRTIGHRA